VFDEFLVRKRFEDVQYQENKRAGSCD
jgi:hypothetical protein